jgi:hypothetical protein
MRRLKAFILAVLLLGTRAASSEEAVAIPADQLDSLVAPIALYPDPLLAQTLAASTYPLEIVQLQQWLAKNPGLKGEALAGAVAKQSWDPSVQAMAALPEVVKRLADDIQWTTDLGNAFLTQQADVMASVQRMRKKAQDAGKLKSSDKQKVETQVVENKSVIVVEQADPQVVYVPVYDPVVVYGPPVYPYPPIYYPPYPYGGMAVSFGVGVAMGAFWGGGWGWGCSWRHSDIDINVNNRFSRNSVVQANGRWQHDARHRGGTPYPNRGTADRFGGMTAGDSLANRQAGARDQISRQGDGFGGSGGADRVGSRDLSRTEGSSGAFDGGNRRYSGSYDRAAASRGASSMGGRGGMSRGGGGRRR